MGKNFYRRLLISLAALALVACKPPELEGDSVDGRDALAHNFTLGQAEFNSLEPTQQYMVANKALSTLFLGVPLDEFFDLTKGLDNPVVQQTNFMSAFQARLQTPLTQAQINDAEADILGRDDNPETDFNEDIPARYSILDPDHPHQTFMARMQAYPVSRDQFAAWMSYFLANTIMFSPAREMDSANSQDIVRVLSYLEQGILEGKPIRDIVRGWMHNLSRWRVSRSPENHALEMFELYLGIFNDTPEEQQNTINGGIACDDWYLTDNNADYQLQKVLTRASSGSTVKVMGEYLSSCEDLYDLVAGHPLLIPRVVEVIVSFLLSGEAAVDKLALIQQVLSTAPTTFEDVFLAVIFSKAFLLHSQRPKSFEENTWGFLNSMHYTPRWSDNNYLGRKVLDYMLDSTNNSAPIGVHNMGLAAMDYKIGRLPILPMDVLSFATYHKGMRERVLMNNRAFSGQEHPTTEEFTEDETSPRQPPYKIHNGAFYVAGTQNLKPELENLSVEEFIDFVFLTALGRRALDEEAAVWIEEGLRRDYVSIDEEGANQLTDTDGELFWENRTDDFAEVMLDYISRLPEFYYYKAVTQ
jgi:hypothetical protein